MIVAPEEPNPNYPKVINSESPLYQPGYSGNQKYAQPSFYQANQNPGFSNASSPMTFSSGFTHNSSNAVPYQFGVPPAPAPGQDEENRSIMAFSEKTVR